MTDSDLLAVLVEFSIGLGGFSAIAAAFIHQSQAMKAEDVYRVLNMLLMALGPAFIALFALGVLKVSLPIQYANGLLLLFTVVSILQAELGRRRLTSEQQKVLIPLVIVLMQSTFVINGLFQLLACLYILQEAFIVLYGGLVVVLAQAVVQFVRLIVARPGT
jgi:hypothetical protein